MNDNDTEQQLTACIRTALERHGFAPPKTPDTSITGAYTDATTDAVMLALAAEGWRMGKAAGHWAPGDLSDPGALEDMLRSTIRFPIQMARKPPRKRGETEIARYHRAVAEDVVRHLGLVWEFGPGRILLKKPPLSMPGPGPGPQ